jgi:hypothetical protein
MPTYTAEETLVAVRCGECGVWFGMTEFMHAKRLEDKKFWFCPNGHNRHFIGKSEAEKARERAEAAERRLAATRDLLTQEERSHAATRGHLTRVKKRASAGVCPCCNRTFQQLARHMKSKHPEFPEETTTS